MTLTTILAAFGGGILGAGVGGLIGFIFVGIFGLIGIAVMAAGGGGDFLNNVAFGPAWAPAMGGFASGVAAAAYAASKGKLEKGNDIATPVFKLGMGDALIVGGIFGVLGHALVWLLGEVGIAPWTDGVALVVFVSAAIVRLVWGKSGLMGQCPGGESRYGAVGSNVLNKVAIGVGAGLFSAFFVNVIGADKGGVVLGFCFSAASLIFLELGVSVPVTHHYTLPAAVAANLAGGSMIWGGIFGLLGAFLGDFFACTFNAYGDTHIDPPACTIATLTTLAIVMDKIGLLFSLP